MKNTGKSKISFNEMMLWAGVVLLSAMAFFSVYYFDFSTPIKALIWISWFSLASLIVFFTSQGKEIFAFSKEAKIELQKVVWPSRQETIQTTSIVMIMVAITGFVLWGIDSGMMWVIAKLTHLG